MEFLAEIFGYIIRAIYSLTNNNYALSIILFTVFTKIIISPLSYKQTKTSIKMQKLKPKQNEIVKKYKDNKVKQSEELTKLYKDNNVNMFGGCLPALIQIPIILSIFYIVRQPLTYILEMPKEEITIYEEQIYNSQAENKKSTNIEIEIANKYELIDMEMLGLNLGDVPSNVFNEDESKKSEPVSLIIPILAVIISMTQIKRMKKYSNLTKEQQEMQKSMNMTMPLLSGIISYTMPLALGIYWLFGGIIQIIQSEIINRILRKDENPKLFLEGNDKNEKND